MEGGERGGGGQTDGGWRETDRQTDRQTTVVMPLSAPVSPYLFLLAVFACLYPSSVQSTTECEDRGEFSGCASLVQEFGTVGVLKKRADIQMDVFGFIPFSALVKWNKCNWKVEKGLRAQGTDSQNTFGRCKDDTEEITQSDTCRKKNLLEMTILVD